MPKEYRVDLEEETDCKDCKKLKALVDTIKQFCQVNMVDPDEPAEGYDALQRIFCQAIIQNIERHTV